MSLRELVVAYLLVGGVLAVLRQRYGPDRSLGERLLEAGLLSLLWPLYGPFLLLSAGAPAEAAATQDDLGRTVAERAFVGALRRARVAGLTELLPEAGAVERLRLGLRQAEARLADMDELLGRPDFSEEQAATHHEQLLAEGAGPAAAAAHARLEQIRRLLSLRQRQRGRLREIEEMLRQLQVQIELVRLAGGTGEDARAGVASLLSRLQGVSVVLQGPEQG